MSYYNDYLKNHSNPKCRLFHFIGQWVTILFTIFVLYNWYWYLIPVIPFFAVNMLAGLLKVNFNSYLFSTIIGIAPASFVFASFGSGADSVILNKKLPGIEIFLDIKFVLPVLIIFCL